ncbi:MAG: S1 RNA-binding domain-containing protein [Desulfobacterales bacterium]|nr:S1 RNA-binding domain-containing protein [Desulfobacterales bacterium]
MSTKLLINASDPEEIRVATVKDGRLEEFRVESAAREITQGNIYKGVITRVEPSLQAAFVDYGADRNGFLQKHDIHYDYFHEEDRGTAPLQRLVKRGQELMVQIGKDPIGTKGAMLTTFISLPGRLRGADAGALRARGLAQDRGRGRARPPEADRRRTGGPRRVRRHRAHGGHGLQQDHDLQGSERPAAPVEDHQGQGDEGK